jgi:hypothetical protein
VSLRLGERALVGAGIVYLAVLAWSMANTSYDIWGALVVAPPLAVLGYAGVRRMFRGDLLALANIMYLGLAVKMCGALVRYWVAFDAYAGKTDAERYHQFASEAANAVWAGEKSWTSVVPHGTGTAFMERLTALILTTTGTSKLGAFLTFSWLSFWGVAFFVLAACVAIPGLARRRYALLCVLAPSIAYWPSSIGKEAWMMLTLGVATYGIARLLSRRGFVAPVLLGALGLVGAGLVRPHMAAIWLAGLLPALVVTLLRGRTDRRRGRAADRAAIVVVLAVAVIGLSIMAQATVRYLDPNESETVSGSDTISEILAETTRRTSEAGSNFTPITVEGPRDWPVASLRTLTRPLLIEANGAGQMLAALELSAFFVLCALAYRRVLNLPRLLVTNAYVAFAMATLFLGGLAYSSFANLGVLTRQKSLLFPFLLLIPCLPARVWQRPGSPDTDRTGARSAADRVDQNSSTSPSVSAQLESGGMPASLTSRQVRIGPPPGSRANPADIWG